VFRIHHKKVPGFYGYTKCFLCDTLTPIIKSEDAMTTLYQALGLEGNGGVISIVGAGGKTSLMFRLAHELSGLGQSVLTTTTTKIMMPRRSQSSHVILTTSSRTLIDNAVELLKESLHISAASPRLPEHQGKIAGFSAVIIDEIRRSSCFQWILVEADGAAQKPLKVPADHEPVIPGSSNWVIAVVGLAAIGKPLQNNWVFRHARYASITGLSEGMPVTPASVVKALIHPSGIFKGCPSRGQKILFLNTAGEDHRLENGRILAEKLLEAKNEHDIGRIVIGSPLEKAAVAEHFK
jgi:probable selenium-dependent hydroxylase accessory protein YqeC